MGTRRYCLALALLLLPGQVWADRHNWEVSASPSRSSGSQLWGGSFSVARTLHGKGVYNAEKPYRWTAFADLSVHGGSHAGESVTQVSVLGGPRFLLGRTLKVNREPYPYRLQFFGQALGGYVHVSGKGHLAEGLGVGFDGLFSDYGGVRGQVDYVHFGGDTGRTDFVRFSIGVVYRFEKD